MTRMFTPHPSLTLRDDVLPALGLCVTQAAEFAPSEFVFLHLRTSQISALHHLQPSPDLGQFIEIKIGCRL